MNRSGTTWSSVVQWLAASWLVFALVGPAAAAFHLFRINEVYSSADGTVQFVELKESTGSDFESFWMGNALTSTQGSTVRTFIFPTNLPSTSTASKSVVVATPAFAAAAGISPDFVVPAPFLFPGGGTINYAGVDSVTYAALPTDGVTSIDRNGVRALATPSNFAGQTGSLAPAPPPAVPATGIPTLGTSGLAIVVALIAFAAFFAQRGTARKS
jgi:hypothetical protein